VSIEFVSERDYPVALSGELFIWPSTQSYTRQCSAEFHTIGSAPLLDKVLRRICDAGARLAQPGEFTMRAFLSGRLDLPQSEAILSVIDASAESQLKRALQQLAGGLSGPLQEVREQLTWILAEIEAGLDFAEEDLEFLSRAQMIGKLSELESSLKRVASQIKSRDAGAQLIRVALVGLPNAGKSSLFNALLGVHRAMVSQNSGTTTDFLTGQLELDGLLVELVDTAGIETVSIDEGEISRAMLAQRQRETVETQAQIRLYCVDSSEPLDKPFEYDRTVLVQDSGRVTILVLTKMDLAESGQGSLSEEWCEYLAREHQLVKIQIPALDQLRELRHAVRFHALRLLETQGEMVASTLVRTASSLTLAVESVRRALECAKSGAGEELIAGEIRVALDELGLVVGTVYTDDILDVVFSRFCIGK
jgi:tRNA modification GTPase